MIIVVEICVELYVFMYTISPLKMFHLTSLDHVDLFVLVRWFLSTCLLADADFVPCIASKLFGQKKDDANAKMTNHLWNCDHNAIIMSGNKIGPFSSGP